MARGSAKWIGLDRNDPVFVHLRKLVADNVRREILEDLGKTAVSMSQNKIANDQVRPRTTAKTFAARRVSGRGKLVRKKGASRRTRQISKKLGPVQRGITLLDTGKGIKAIKYSVSRDVLRWGVNGYMAYHQDGTLDGVLPKREFLEIPSEKQSIETVYRHWRKIK